VDKVIVKELKFGFEKEHEEGLEQAEIENKKVDNEFSEVQKKTEKKEDLVNGDGIYE